MKRPLNAAAARKIAEIKNPPDIDELLDKVGVAASEGNYSMYLDMLQPQREALLQRGFEVTMSICGPCMISW